MHFNGSVLGNLRVHTVAHAIHIIPFSVQLLRKFLLLCLIKLNTNTMSLIHCGHTVLHIGVAGCSQLPAVIVVARNHSYVHAIIAAIRRIQYRSYGWV